MRCTQRQTGRLRPATWLAAVGLLGGGLAGGLTGCEASPLAAETQIRTPYDRYRTLRGTERPRTTVDSFGRERPALRARLTPVEPD